MDGNTQIIIAFIFAAVVLGLAWRFRGKIKASIKFLGAEVSVEGENPAQADAPAPAHNAQAPESAQPAESRTRLDTAGGVTIEDAKAGGGILAEDSTGGGVKMKGVEAGDDIIASSSKPGAAPKA